MSMMRVVACGVLAVLGSCVQVWGLERDPGRCGPGRPFGAGTQVPIVGN